VKTIKEKTFGCSNKNIMDKIVNFLLEGDHEAFTKGLSVGMAMEVCINFDAGQKVFQEDRTFFYKCVRPKGSFSCYWVDPDDVVD